MSISGAEITHFPKKSSLRIKDKLIDLGSPKIMGIINATPDSFFASSRKTTVKDVLKSAEKMILEGADIIDLGAYSSRPGAEFVDEKTELDRILEPLQELRKEFPNTLISLDTFRSEVAKQGIHLGADIINDIGAFDLDKKMIDIIAETGIAYIIMHGASNLKKMYKTALNEDLFRDICYFFSNKINQLKEKGITEIIIDPGFGFGKTIEQNHQIINQLEMFDILNLPILVGISRKSMIYKKLGINSDESLNGTTILNTIAIQRGASILRVHDVKEAKQIIDLLS
ncbi:MAG: dihydropteroate synthase [Flavobacteriia bacterium]